MNSRFTFFYIDLKGISSKFFFITKITLWMMMWMYADTSCFSQVGGGLYLQQDEVINKFRPNTLQGRNAAISADGNKAIINNGHGADYFVRINNRWIQQKDSIEMGSILPSSISMSADGNTAILGGATRNIQQTNVALTFTHIDGTWKRLGDTIVIKGLYQDRFANNISQGYTVAISGDGNTIMLGLGTDSLNNGAVAAFIRSGNTWIQQGNKLVSTTVTSGAGQGTSLALSSDGNTAIVGATGDSPTGAAIIYAREGAVWKQQGNKLVGSGYVGYSRQGLSVSISADGNTAVIGAEMDNHSTGNDSPGASWVFVRKAGLWLQQGQKLVGSGATGPSSQGWAISISGDGNTFIVTGITDNPQTGYTGAVWVFKRSDTTWTQYGTKLVGRYTENGPQQGLGLAISFDGNTIISAGISSHWIFQKIPLFSLTSSKIESTPDSLVPIKYSIQNKESYSSPVSYITYFFSSDLVYDSTDVALGSIIAIPAITGSSSLQGSAVLKIPKVVAGEYNILAVLDINYNSAKYASTLVIGKIPCTVGFPEIHFSNTVLNSSSNPQVGDTIVVSTILENTGSVNSIKPVQVQYFISKDNVYDSSDSLISAVTVPVIGADTSVPLKLKYRIPGGKFSEGSNFVLIVADKSNSIYETNKLNNTASVPFQLIVPHLGDLTVKNLSVSNVTLLPGDATDISCSIFNSGADAAAFTFKYYLSFDKEYDDTDIKIVDSVDYSGIGTETTLSVPKKTFIIPANLPSGVYYIIAYADANNSVKEIDDNNNTASVQIKVGSFSNLILVNPSVDPSSVVPGNTVSISSTIINLGSINTGNAFNIQYYLSDDTIFNNNSDVPLGSAIQQKAMEGNDVVNIAARTYTIPATTLPGKYFILLIADPDNVIKESSESDNSKSFPFTVIGLPDFILQSLKVDPPSQYAGDSVLIGCTIINQGGKSTNTIVDLQYFLSSDPFYDFDDLPISSTLLQSSPSPGASLIVPSRKFLIPSTVKAGSKYVVAVVDLENNEKEISDDNNSKASPLTISLRPGNSDLTVRDAVVSSSQAVAGDFISIACNVKNIGTSPTSAVTKLQYALSSDTLFDSADVLLNPSPPIPILASGVTDTLPLAQYLIPAALKAGRYFLLLYADAENEVAEIKENNNIAKLVLTISPRPDLTINNANATPGTLYPGDSSSISCTVSNIGNGPVPLKVNLQYYLSTDKFYSKEDILLTGTIPVPGLASNTKQNITNAYYQIPDTTPSGNYYILLYVDNTNVLMEVSDSNNIASVPVKVLPFSNLVVDGSIAKPAKVFPGDSVTFSGNIHNTGEGTTEIPFKVRYYLSKNKIFDGGDIIISDLFPIPALSAGQSVPTKFAYKFPQNTLSGAYYIIIVADAGSQIHEGEEADNFGVANVVVGQSSATNLEVTRVFANPNIVLPGSTITIDGTVKNSGNANTGITTNLQFFLSTDKEVDNSDIAISEVFKINPLDIGLSQTFPSFPYRIPVSIKPGDYYVLGYADLDNTLSENTEEDNLASSILIISPSPDLQINKMLPASNSIYIGDSVSVTSTVVNYIGSDTKTNVSLQYFLSNDQLVDKNDIPLGSSLSIPNLTVKKAYDVPATKIKIPQNIPSGFYYVISYVDSKDEIIESDEKNNFFATLVTILPRPVITLQDPGNVNTVNNGNLDLPLKVNSELPLASVYINYFGLTNPANVITQKLASATASYLATIPVSSFDDIGVEYSIVATDSSGHKSIASTESVPVQWPQGLDIPYSSYGAKQENYRIIAIPLVLQHSGIDTILSKSLGGYENKKWRIFNYANQINANIEFQHGINSIDPGKGYWFISNTKALVPLNSGPGKTVKATIEEPFSIPLEKGWNQIGNPYNLDLRWSDVKNYKKNNPALLATMYKWQGRWNVSDTLNKMEGAFVFAKENTRLYFPTTTTNKTQRLASVAPENMNPEAWNLDLRLQSEDLTYQLAGVGMHPDASISIDEFDQLTPPRFFNYLEISTTHPEYFYHGFTKDIVPASDTYNWTITVDAASAGTRTLTWDSSYFSDRNQKGNGEKHLYLYDKETERALDMGSQGSYRFKAETTRNLSIYYGPDTYIGEHLSASAIYLGAPYPNPFSESTTVSLSMPKGEEYLLHLGVYNALGQQISTLAAGKYSGGFYKFSWNRGAESLRNGEGLYMIRLNVSTKSGQRVITRKVEVMN